jgi:6,7-dimethyl-8-ribityllumazine synthase
MNTRNKLALLALAVSIPLILGVLTTSGLAGYSPLEDKAADTPGRAQLKVPLLQGQPF